MFSQEEWIGIILGGITSGVFFYFMLKLRKFIFGLFNEDSKDSD